MQAIPHIIRFLLSLLTGYLAYIGVQDIDLNVATFGGLIGAGIIFAINYGLKRMDATQYGPLLRALIGPRTKDIALSMTRSLVTALAGATVGYLNMDGATLEHATVYEVLSLVVATIFAATARKHD